jgi:hypothetical protein
MSYFTGVDADRLGAEILQHRVFMSVGHDEYWSGGQRANVEAARGSGVNLAFFSGNESFWKTRWESSIDGSNTAFRTLVSYKETHANAPIDPLDPPTWTGTWRDPRFSPPADGGRPENGLTGTIFMVNCCTYAIAVPAADGKMRFWRNTTIAALPPGATATLPDGTLGYEWDEDLDNGARPAGLVDLSTTTVDVPQRLLDYGSNYGPGMATHRLTMYRAPSGALVFGAGTVQWSWGLDATHDRSGGAASNGMRQATVNLLADMSTQPATLQRSLVPASASTDVTPPDASIDSPGDGSTVQAGVPVMISGTASDNGGAVGVVEVSVDGGTTWHPATGRASWTRTWIPTDPGSHVTILSRAADDSGNLGPNSQPVTVTVVPRSCPCSLWSDDTKPTSDSQNDDQPIEVGVRFQPEVGGTIEGLRFYKGAANTGVHVGHLWTNDGTMLAGATYTNETGSGWQKVSLTPPVAVKAGTTYVASYHSPTGTYADDQSYFGAAFENPPLRAPADGEAGANGVYRYGVSGFPTQTFEASNYWVDVVFTPSQPPPTITSFSPTSGKAGTAVTITGTGFTGATAVAFGGATASFTVASDTRIDAMVPVAAVTGPITVTTPAGTATSATAFTVLPKVTSFRPTSGPPGTVVRITGTGLTGTTKVTFGGVKATFSVDGVTSITATVPAGARTGRIKVITPYGKAKSKATFTVT